MSPTTEFSTKHRRVEPHVFNVLLTDGTTAQVRSIEPTDAHRLVMFHEALAPDSAWFRCFGIHRHLIPDEVTRFTTVDGCDRVAVVALVDDDLVGIARYERRPERRDAEVAVVVADTYHGTGIATVLLERLADRARRNGIKRFVVEAPPSTKMLEFFRDAGFDGTTETDEGLMRMSVPLVSNHRTRARRSRRSDQR